MPTSNPTKSKALGMTLLEVMVVLAIIGLVLGVAVSQYNDMFSVHLKETSQRLSSTIQFLYNKAATEGLTMRIVYDLDKQSYWVEATTDRFMLEKEDERKPSKEKAAKADEKPDEKGDAEKKAEAKFSAEDSYLLKPVQLPSDVFFKDIYTEHNTGPVSSGTAYTYIFPNGYVEKTIINLRDEEDKEHFAIEVNPLSGSTRTYGEHRELQK